MRSKQLRLESYETDKVANGYLPWYDPNFEHLVERELSLLEIGVRKGGSLLLWRDYFPSGNIVGVDWKSPPNPVLGERIHFYQGRQNDRAFLSEVAARTAPMGFDIIIDDGSHIASQSRVAFWHLFDNHLKPSGLYVIEDWGTGYWDDWPDGRAFQPPRRHPSKWRKILGRRKPSGKTPLPNHGYGLVGFIKQLIDEQGAGDLTRARSTGIPSRLSKFEKMVVTPSIVFITKSATANS